MAQTKGVLTNKRQSEMSELINLLKDFKPTKVALEVLNKNEEGLNQDYFSYQKGDFALSSNEIHQIGFQLANKCNLGKVNAVDWNDDLKDVPDLGKLAGNNESKFYDQALKIGNEITSQSEEYYQHHSIKEYLLWLNEKENIAKGQEMYMKLALVGSENDPTGAIWTAKYWYYRNMLIYKNLVNLIDSGGERIFVLYGFGHLHLLLQFLKESGLFNIQSPCEYIK